MVAHLLCKQGVACSNHVSSTPESRPGKRGKRSETREGEPKQNSPLAKAVNGALRYVKYSALCLERWLRGLKRWS